MKQESWSTTQEEKKSFRALFLGEAASLILTGRVLKNGIRRVQEGWRPRANEVF